MRHWALAVALGLSGCCGPTKEEIAARKAAEDREVAAYLKRQADGTALAKQENEAAVANGRARLAKVTAVWAAYDKLPKAQRTKATMIEAMAEGRTHAAGLPPVHAGQVEEFNRREGRKRIAPIMNAEATAQGEKSEILVPSPERVKCLIWGGQWAQEADSLRSMGYEQIHCNEMTYKSRLTGDFITDPERNWNLKTE